MLARPVVAKSTMMMIKVAWFRVNQDMFAI
jgi:hypothetical protein